MLLSFFDELLIFFWLTKYFLFEFYFLLDTQMRTSKETNDKIITNKNTFSLVSDVNV